MPWKVGEMSEELKPCPFCGGQVILDKNDKRRRPWSIVCTECGIVNDDWAVSDQLVKEWNTRPIEDYLISKIVELKAAQRFIPVGERLPEDQVQVMCVEVRGAYSVYEVSRYIDDLWMCQIIRPTHWMPLPKPPEVTE